MNTVTLMTDFGIKDGNVGVMKGVIWGIAPEVKIADLSHIISPQNVSEAALVLGRSAPYFPQGTVHIVVVDPGVGTERRPIAAELGPQRFVGPDNGVITLLYHYAEEKRWPIKIVHTDNRKYWLPEVSDVFHGRDIFSPVGAWLASGISLEKLGTLIGDPVLLEIPSPIWQDGVLSGEVMHIDHFGNIGTNIRRSDLANRGPVSISLAGVEIKGVMRTFGERDLGELIALYGSTGYLIASVVNGNAAARLGVKVGDPVTVISQSHQSPHE